MTLCPFVVRRSDCKRRECRSLCAKGVDGEKRNRTATAFSLSLSLARSLKQHGRFGCRSTTKRWSTCWHRDRRRRAPPPSRFRPISALTPPSSVSVFPFRCLLSLCVFRCFVPECCDKAFAFVLRQLDGLRRFLFTRRLRGKKPIASSCFTLQSTHYLALACVRYTVNLIGKQKQNQQFVRFTISHVYVNVSMRYSFSITDRWGRPASCVRAGVAFADLLAPISSATLSSTTTMTLALPHSSSQVHRRLFFVFSPYYIQSFSHAQCATHQQQPTASETTLLLSGFGASRSALRTQPPTTSDDDDDGFVDCVTWFFAFCVSVAALVAQQHLNMWRYNGNVRRPASLFRQSIRCTGDSRSDLCCCLCAPKVARFRRRRRCTRASTVRTGKLLLHYLFQNILLRTLLRTTNMPP
jgi:hypothetical protein